MKISIELNDLLALDEAIGTSEFDENAKSILNVEIDEDVIHSKIQDIEMLNEEDSQDANDMDPKCTLLEAINCIDKLKKFGKTFCNKFPLDFLENLEKISNSIAQSKSLEYSQSIISDYFH